MKELKVKQFRCFACRKSLWCCRKGESVIKKQNKLNNLVLSAMFLALALVLPFLTGQIPEVGNMLCPMHIPVLLCGFMCSSPWGAAVGFIAPLFRSLLFGKPVMFPVAISMAFELAVYGFVTGLLYKVLPKKNGYIYISLIAAMISGRAVWGLIQFLLLKISASGFGFAAFWAGAFTNAIPGIILQLVFVPVIVMLCERFKRQK